MAKKAPTLKDNERRLLAEAADALTTNNPGMATKADLKALLTYPADHGGPLVEVNEGIKDGDKIAFRATPNGVAVATTLGIGPAAAPAGNPADNTNPPGATVPPVVAPAEPVKTEFVLETGVAIPPIKRGGRAGTGTKYPFEQMQVQQSFFIPKTAENPKPAKRIASVVSNWNKKYSATDDKRKFRCQAVTETAGDGSKREGARVWRIA